jgi:type IV pilus assembly protein PilE
MRRVTSEARPGQRATRASPRATGLTLLELLTVLAVLAIVAAIAVPGYRAQVLRAQHSEATTALLRIGTAQEAHFLQHNRFATSLSAAPPAGLGLAPITERGYYDLEIELTAADGSAYLTRARPRAAAGQRDDALCREFMLDRHGLRGARNALAADTTTVCWR